MPLLKIHDDFLVLARPDETVVEQTNVMRRAAVHQLMILVSVSCTTVLGMSEDATCDDFDPVTCKVQKKRGQSAKCDALDKRSVISEYCT